MTWSHLRSYSLTISVSIFAAFVGLIIPGCSSTPPPITQQSTQGSSIPNTNVPSGDIKDTNGNTEKKTDPNPQNSVSSVDKDKPPFVGTRFFNFLGGNGTGKSITIDADGTTTVKLHGTVSSSVEYSGQFSNPIILNDGGKLLLKDDKIYLLSANGQIAKGCKGDEKPCESSLFEPSLPPSDDRFKQQDFSQQLFKQVHKINKECGFYDVTSPCSSRTYTFRDTVLTTTRVGTESVTNTLIPNQPVSRQQALIYTQVLNSGEELDPAKLTTESKKIIYRGCPYDAGGKELASLCQAELNLTNDGSISRIEFTHISH